MPEFAMNRLNALLLITLMLTACGDDDAVCMSGMSVPCECPGGQGVQACGADGSFDGCICLQEDAGVELDAQTSDIVEAMPDGAVDSGAADSGAVDSGGPDVPVVMDDNCDDGTCVFVSRMFNIPGQAAGIYGENLDGEVTLAGDPTGCGARDYTSGLDGTPGVDNTVLALLPLIDGMATVSLSDRYANALVEGELLMVTKLEGVDGADDESVEVSLWYGMIVGTPTFDDEGLVDGGQTITAISPVSVVTGAIVDGRFRAVFPEIPFSIGLFSGLSFLPLSDARVSANIEESTLLRGMIAGSLDLGELAAAMALSPGISVDQALDLLDGFADMEPVEGMCQALSVGASFESVHARED